jgi:hypothetical protein
VDRRLNRAGRRSRRGSSLVETLLALSMLSLVIAAATRVGNKANDAYETSSARTELELRAQRALEDAARALVAASTGLDAWLVPSPPPADSSDLTSAAITGPFGVSDLFWERVTAFDGVTGAVTGAERQRLFARPESGDALNGVDDDGDGLVDEFELVLAADPGQPSERERVLVRGLASLGAGELANALDDDGDGVIDESGFCVRRRGDALVLQITLQEVVPGTSEPLLVEKQTAISLRN